MEVQSVFVYMVRTFVCNLLLSRPLGFSDSDSCSIHQDADHMLATCRGARIRTRRDHQSDCGPWPCFSSSSPSVPRLSPRRALPQGENAVPWAQQLCGTSLPRFSRTDGLRCALWSRARGESQTASRMGCRSCSRRSERSRSRCVYRHDVTS